MLSAKKDGTRPEAVTPIAALATAGAVETVVDFIQNLQQRLDDFSLEEVAKAEETSKTLLFRLADVQCRLGSLAAIKRSMTAVRGAIEEAGTENLNVSTLDTVDKPLHLQEFVQASKLIQFPGIHRFSQQPVKEIAPDAAANLQIPPTAIAEPAQETVQASPAAYHPHISDAEVMSEYSGAQPTEPASAPSIPPINAEIIEGKAQGALRTIIVRAERPISSTSTALVQVGGDFDQQLLDDLIKNYGEFVSSPDLRTTVEPQANLDITPAGNAKTVLERPPLENVSNSINSHLPTLKKEGEIDRQLKKIIKDYGEYDIYSRQGPINLKLGVIGAFLLLGAVFSGFYFLSSRTALESSNQPSASQSATMPSSTESAGADKNNARGQKAASGTRVSK